MNDCIYRQAAIEAAYQGLQKPSNQDYLDEYGYSGADLVDDEIEVIAWMPLPEPYKEEGENNEDQND